VASVGLKKIVNHHRRDGAIIIALPILRRAGQGSKCNSSSVIDVDDVVDKVVSVLVIVVAVVAPVIVDVDVAAVALVIVAAIKCISSTAVMDVTASTLLWH